jgi:protease-4
VKGFLRAFFGCLLAIIVLVAIVGGIIAGKSSQKPKIKDNSYLVIDIYGEITEYNPPSTFMGEILGGAPETLTRILSNLNKVCVDDRIEGVIIKLSSSNTAGYAYLEEIRGAVKKVQAAGKKVYCFTDSMDRKAYYLAAACDSIFMAPGGGVSFTGMAVRTEHYKNMLDKLRIKVNLHQIKEYKSAAELLTRENMSPESRENKRWMLDDFWNSYTEALEEDRGISEERLIEIMEYALFTPDEALEWGLADQLLYWSEFTERLKGEDDEKLKTVGQCTYAKIKPEKLGLKGKKKIAIIHAQGTIGGRKNKIDPFFGIMMGHESVARELRRARKDEDVAAVVFRVDSPGGSGLASDLISYEVERMKEEKPIVVSMVHVAASGGYYIAYKADKIVADPMTITGSIGSISAKFNMKGFLNMLGITQDAESQGPNALLWSEYRDFTEKEWKRFTENHWQGFNDWLEDVAEHRGMTFEEAKSLAYGRVWSGRQAVDNGLIDDLGGLDRAIEIAKELAEIPAEEKVTCVHYPKKKEFFEMLMGGGGFSAAARYVVYRYIREDLAETWDMLANDRMYLMDNMAIE